MGENEILKMLANKEHGMWTLLCGALQRMGCVSERVMHTSVGRYPENATDREKDECNLMDLIRGWADSYYQMKEEENRYADEK